MFRWIIAGLLAVQCILLVSGVAMCESSDGKRFEIHILRERLIDILPYDYDHLAWNRLLQSRRTDDAILTQDDIELYRWRDQAIVLTPSASERFKWLDSSKTRMGIDLFEKTFVVCLGDQSLFGGSFIDTGSARGIDYPVIYVDRSGPNMVFQIRPSHSVLEGYGQLSPKLKARIELPAVKSYFGKLGKLK